MATFFEGEKLLNVVPIDAILINGPGEILSAPGGVYHLYNWARVTGANGNLQLRTDGDTVVSSFPANPGLTTIFNGSGDATTYLPPGWDVFYSGTGQTRLSGMRRVFFAPEP